jgi:hypothetical protein
VAVVVRRGGGGLAKRSEARRPVDALRGPLRPPDLQTAEDRTASRLELFFDLAGARAERLLDEVRGERGDHSHDAARRRPGATGRRGRRACGTVVAVLIVGTVQRKTADLAFDEV